MPAKLDQPGYAEQVATLLSAGLTQEEVGAELGVTRVSVNKWAKDPRVQAHLTRLREERVNRVTRRIDAALEARISDPTHLREMDVKDLVTIRRELLGPQPQRVIASRGVDESEATAELMSKLAQDPELARALGVDTGPPALEGEVEEDDADSA